jgi:hypothetical protein
MEQPILIVSAPRCGSSLLAMTLKQSGVFTGITKPGDKYNKYGYFENIEITNIIVDLLRKNDAGLGKRYQPVNYNFEIQDFNSKIQSILLNEGYTHGKWLYKDPKIALTWKLWNNAFPNAKWIILVRNESETIDSYMRTEFMDAYNNKEQWLDYLNKFNQNINEIKKQTTFFQLDIKDIINNNSKKIEDLYSFIEVKNTDEYLKCVDKKIFGNDKK